MTPEIEALARRAVACPRWRWMPGMLDQHDRRVLDTNTGRNLGFPVWWTDAIACDCYEVYEKPDKARSEWADALPDLSDPATLGCLLALVREAWSEPILSVAWAGGRWYVVQRILRSVHALRWIDTATEAEALVAALEIAP
jgi:hypothetical protein